jgi:Xaa-Pro aminopeptidase
VFARETYVQRRKDLVSRIDGGILVLPGNGESPMNYGDNCFPFRQDSTFLIVWTGDLPTVAERSERAGITDTRPHGALADAVKAAQSAGPSASCRPTAPRRRCNSRTCSASRPVRQHPRRPFITPILRILDTLRRGNPVRSFCCGLAGPRTGAL